MFYLNDNGHVYVNPNNSPQIGEFYSIIIPNGIVGIGFVNKFGLFTYCKCMNEIGNSPQKYNNSTTSADMTQWLKDNELDTNYTHSLTLNPDVHYYEPINLSHFFNGNRNDWLINRPFIIPKNIIFSSKVSEEAKTYKNKLIRNENIIQW